MIVRISWTVLTVLYGIALLLCILSAILNIAAAIIRRKRRLLPECENCQHCMPIPKKVGYCFLSTERHCSMGRGKDTFCNAYVSVTAVSGFCDEYQPRLGKEKQHG